MLRFEALRVQTEAFSLGSRPASNAEASLSSGDMAAEDFLWAETDFLFGYRVNESSKDKRC